MDLATLLFDSYKIWFHLLGLLIFLRSELDIRFILYVYLPINNIKPRKHQIIPPKGYKVKTTLPLSKRVLTCINVEDDDGVTFVEFGFLKLPTQYFHQCRKLGHQIEACYELLDVGDNIVLVLPTLPPTPAYTHRLPPPVLQAQNSPRRTTSSTINPTTRFVTTSALLNTTHHAVRTSLSTINISGPTDNLIIATVRVVY